MDRMKAMETFVRIAKSGSLARAADQLGMSRSLISKHLQQLEAHLGVRLFNRTTRQIALTEIGIEYCAFCNRVLSEIGEEERSLAYLNSQPRGSLKIISPMGYGNLHLAPVVASFMRTYPHINVTVVLSDTSMTPVDLIENGFDLAVRTGEIADMNLPARRIGDVRWRLCAAPGYLDGFGAPQTPDALGNHNCLLHRKISPDSVWFFGTDGLISVPVSGTLMTNSVLIIREGRSLRRRDCHPAKLLHRR